MNLCSIQVKGRSPVHIQHNIRRRRGGVYLPAIALAHASFRIPELGSGRVPSHWCLTDGSADIGLPWRGGNPQGIALRPPATQGTSGQVI